MKLKELEKRLRTEPTNLGLRVQVAGLMREAGRSVEAVELYRSVALAYRDQGRTQQAIAVCRSILEIAPEDAACQGLLAMLQQRSQPAKPEPAPPPPSPPAAPAVTMSMRGSPLPPAPEVPSLREANRAVTSRPLEKSPSKQHPAQQEPARRSSLDETPLPRAVPYHVVDPTSQPNKISAGDLEADDKKRSSGGGGLAQAARRISGLISETRGVPQEMDLAAELDTRQRRKIASEELEKISRPPPTIPVERIDEIDDLDLPTPPPRDTQDMNTDRNDALTPPPRGSEESFELTPPPRGSEDAITPPPLTGAMPQQKLPALPRVPPKAAPPSGKTPSRPPGTVTIPPKSDHPTPVGTPPSKLRPVPRPSGPPARPGMPKIVTRDSDDEMTEPRDRTDDDDE